MSWNYGRKSLVFSNPKEYDTLHMKMRYRRNAEGKTSRDRIPNTVIRDSLRITVNVTQVQSPAQAIIFPSTYWYMNQQRVVICDLLITMKLVIECFIIFVYCAVDVVHWPTTRVVFKHLLFYLTTSMFYS